MIDFPLSDCISLGKPIRRNTCKSTIADLKTFTQNYIHRVWQETWDQQILNKLHSIHPSTSHWAALPVRRHDVRLTRLRIGHTRFTHKHLLLGENAPECPSCKVPYSVYHILIDCSVFNRHRIEVNEIHHDTRLDARQSLAEALSTIQVTIRFSSVPPQFEGDTLGEGSGASHLCYPSTDLTTGVAGRWLFPVPPCREGTIHLQTRVFSGIRTQSQQHSSQRR
ncbi:RNase H domain-containing protein [Trichonephila clavipes]|nr:RNase H domain-containing protein [Trichonephila clavipes]